MKRIVCCIVLLAMLGSCKKTKLEGELSVLVGKWEWKQTLVVNNVCEPFIDTIITHSPDMDGFTYEIEFYRKGKLEIYVNGKKDKKYRLVERDFSHSSQDTAFSFYLNNKEKNAIRLFYRVREGKTYLESNDLPLNVLDGFDGCRAEYSVFEKVN